MSLKLQILTRNKFYGYRNIFYRQAEANPITATLIQTTASGGGFEGFVGDSERTEIRKTIHCLYDLQALTKRRTEFGIQEDTEAVIYISPISLYKLFQFKKFPNTNQYKVIYRDQEYVISFVRYLEEMFGDCIAIQLELKTARRGG